LATTWAATNASAAGRRAEDDHHLREWGADPRGDRKLRAHFAGLGLEVHPTNAPIHQEEEIDGDDYRQPTANE